MNQSQQARIAFTSALSEACSKPLRGFRNLEPFPEDEARACFAEFLRETMNDRCDANR